MSSSHVTLINVIEVPAESIDQFISDWKSDMDFMIRQSGFIEGVLHRVFKSDARFRFVNVARCICSSQESHNRTFLSLPCLFRLTGHPRSS
jgi:hypothetical protein